MEEELLRPMCQMSDQTVIRSNLNLGEIGLTNSRVALVVVRLAAFVATATLVTLLYAHILRRLVEQWIQDPNYSHGFFVPVFCLWFAWQKRRSILSAISAPAATGLVVILAALMMLIAGVFGAELYLSRTSLLFLIAGLVICFFGWRIFRTILLPWSILFLAVPLPAIILNQISLPLQLDASRLASAMLTLLGVPVLREGNIIALPSLTLDVAQACSGLHSLVSLITLAVLYGCVFEPKLSRRLFLIFVAIPIAVVANAFRIVGAGILGSYWRGAAEGFVHLFSGVVIFICSLVLLLTLHSAMRWLGKSAPVGPS